MNAQTSQTQAPNKKSRKVAESVSKVLLWLFVINLGIVFGAGLYEARIEFPQWLVYLVESGYRWNAEAARQANTGLRFWVYVTTIPLTLLTFINLIAAWRSQGILRRWWLGAAVVAIVDRIFTFSYFVPTMITLMSNETLSESKAVAMATQWGNLNSLRLIIVLIAWLAALKAFSLLYEYGYERATINSLKAQDN